MSPIIARSRDSPMEGSGGGGGGGGGDSGGTVRGQWGDKGIGDKDFFRSESPIGLLLFLRGEYSNKTSVTPYLLSTFKTF